MTGLLHLAGVRRAYGSTTALAGVDLRLEAGRHLALTGPSGSGKSTLVRAVAGLERVDPGTVSVNDGLVRPGSARRTRWLRRLVQVVPQDASGSLDPRHRVDRIVAEPIHCLGLDDDPVRRPAELVERVGLEQDVLARRPGQLSGGQRQRVALARALAARPSLLVGDEMFSRLDAVTRLALVDTLRDVVASGDVTLLLVAHDLGTVRLLCPDLAVLDEGRVVEHGATDAVLAAPRHPTTRALVDAAGWHRAGER